MARVSVKKMSAKPNCIIFAVSEQMLFADWIKEILINTCDAEVWNEGFFELSSFALSNFYHMPRRYDFAILVLSPDDEVTCRGEVKYQPRDNLLFELGACMQFQQSNVIVLKHRKCRVPTDVWGFQVYQYDEYTSRDVMKQDITGYIEKVAERQIYQLSWLECMEGIKDLQKKLMTSPMFQYHVIIGIEGGGGLAGDLLNREGGHLAQLFVLNADRRRGKGKEDYDIPINTSMIAAIKEYRNTIIGRFNLLVIDNMARRGHNIIKAKEYLEKCFSDDFDCEVKSAVVYLNQNLKVAEKDKIDYHVFQRPLDGRRLELR